LKKLDEAEDYDAIILAVAGLKRLGWGDRIGEVLSQDVSLHAVSQGALGIECRDNDPRVLALLQTLTHETTSLRCTCERAFLRRLEGGCSVPIGVFSEFFPATKELVLQGGVFSLDGSKQVTGSLKEVVTTPEEAQSLGYSLFSLFFSSLFLFSFSFLNTKNATTNFL
jgi:hydroxymethylbilane synthase